MRVDEAIGLDEDLRSKIRPSIGAATDKTLSARAREAKVGRCRLPVSDLVLKAPMVSALVTRKS